MPLFTRSGEAPEPQAPPRPQHKPSQDYIPPEELARVLASGGGEAARAQAEALEAAQRIGEDNIGHRMLRGMGWREGEGLGAGASGIAAPLAAGAAKAAQDKIGLGAAVRTGR